MSDPGRDPRPDDEPAATADEALAWLRTIRAELRNARVEPPSGRRRPPAGPPRASYRDRLARLAGEPATDQPPTGETGP